MYAVNTNTLAQSARAPGKEERYIHTFIHLIHSFIHSFISPYPFAGLSPTFSPISRWLSLGEDGDDDGADMLAAAAATATLSALPLGRRLLKPCLSVPGRRFGQQYQRRLRCVRDGPEVGNGWGSNRVSGWMISSGGGGGDGEDRHRQTNLGFENWCFMSLALPVIYLFVEL